MRHTAIIAATMLWGLCAAASGATLRVARGQLPATLGNPYTAGGQPGAEIWSALFDGLTAIQPDGSLGPGLATSWDLVDPRQWRFHLRTNVLFHSGNHFDASAVARNITALQSREGRRLYMAAEVAGITAVSTPDAQTVVIETAKPDAVLPRRLSVIMIVDPDLWAKDPAAFALKPSGTGPWRILDWGRSSGRAVFAAFPGSWRASDSIDRLQIAALPQESTRITALLSGQVDIAEGLGPDSLSEFQGQPAHVVTRRSAVAYAIALPNTGPAGAPLRDQRVRQALNYAVDKNEIASRILNNTGRPSAIGCNELIFGCDLALKPYPYDPEKAKALLREAGLPNGFDFQLEVLTGIGPSDQMIFERVAQQLRQVGLRVTLKSTPYPTWLEKYLSNNWGDTNAFGLSWDSSSYYDVSRMLKIYSCEKPAPFFCDRAIADRLVATDEIMEPAERARALESVQRDLYQLAPALWLVEMPETYVVSDGVDHFEAGSRGVNFARVSLAPQHH